MSISIVSVSPTSIAGHAILDAKNSDVRLAIALAAEKDRGSSLDCIVMLDGMGSIAVGFSLLRYLVECDTPRRLALLGVTPDLDKLIDAWERARLDELIDEGRLILTRDSSDLTVAGFLEDWR